MTRAAFALALFTALSAHAEQEDLDPAEDPQDVEQAPAEPRPQRRARGHHDGGIADAFMQGFNEGLQENQRASGNAQLSDEETAAIGFASMCCCFLVLVGLVVLVVVLVRRGNKGAAAAPMAPAQVPLAPPGGTHLSVVAVAFDARLRPQLETTLRAAGVTQSPMDPPSRSALVRAWCGALLETASNWRAFGYGNKSDFANDAEAERSFRAAWTDFKGRCQGAGEPDGDVCVAVLVLCTRGAVLGASRLDDRQQARAVLEHRMGIAPEAMLAADAFFAPLDAATGALSHGDAFRRFPEMQLLGPG
jgi:hypothetical protein